VQVRSTMVVGHHRCARAEARWRRLERLSVMLWRHYKAKSDVVRMLRLICAQLEVRGRKDVLGIIWADVMQHLRIPLSQRPWRLFFKFFVGRS
jgi:hypothetical protein